MDRMIPIGKALDCTGAENCQDSCSDQGGHVTVNNSGQSLVITVSDRSLHADTGCQFLTDTGKNDNIRVNCHTDRQEDTCDSGKCQCDIKAVEYQCHHQNIDGQGKCRCKTGQQIDHDHENRNQAEADQTGNFTGADSILTQLGADDLGAQTLQLDLQAADADRGGKVLCILDGALTGDHRAAVCDGSLNGGHTDKMSVIIDTDGLAGGKSLGGSSSKSLAPLIVECEGDDDLLVAHIILLISCLGIRDLCAGDNRVAVSNDLLKTLGQDVFYTAVLSEAQLIVLVACIIGLPNKVERAGTTQILQDLIGLGNAGNTGNLDIQTICAFCVDLSLRAVLIDTALQFILRIIQVLLGRRLLSHCLISNAGTACQIQALFDVVIRSSVSLAKSDQHSVRHQPGDGR